MAWQLSSFQRFVLDGGDGMVGGIAGESAAARRVAAAVLVALVLVRLAGALVLAPSLTSDSAGYDLAARRLLATGTYAALGASREMWTTNTAGDAVLVEGAFERFLESPRNALTMPGYAAFLAGVYGVSGGGESRELAVRLAQVLLSVASAGLVFAIGCRFGDRVGVMALVFSAAYLPLTMASYYVLSETLYMLSLLVFLWLFLRALDEYRLRWTLAAGMALAATIWVRPVAIGWLAVAVFLVALRTPGPRRVSLPLHVVVMALVVALAMAPWWIRNYGVYRRFVPLVTGSTAQGNAVEGLRWDLTGQQRFPWERAPKPLGGEEFAALALVEEVQAASPILSDGSKDLAHARYYAREYPRLIRRLWADYPLVMLRARVRSVAATVLRPGYVSEDPARGIPFALASVSHLALLGLFVVGVRVAMRTLDGAVLASVPLYFVGFHAFLIPSPRYYLPGAPFALVVSALGFWWLLDKCREPVR